MHRTSWLLGRHFSVGSPLPSNVAPKNPQLNGRVNGNVMISQNSHWAYLLLAYFGNCKFLCVPHRCGSHEESEVGRPRGFPKMRGTSPGPPYRGAPGNPGPPYRLPVVLGRPANHQSSWMTISALNHFCGDLYPGSAQPIVFGFMDENRRPGRARKVGTRKPHWIST